MPHPAPQPEAGLDAVTRLAARLCDVPSATLAIFTDGAPHALAKCGGALADTALLTRAASVTDRSFTAPGDRLFVGVRLLDTDGALLGVLAVADDAPRKLSPEQADSLQLVAEQAAAQLRLRCVVAERDAAREQLAHHAQHDALTGLPNRALLIDRIDRCLRRARRAGTCFALLFLDLDRFKLVNDSLGHAAGDQLLRTVTERLTRTVRDTDTVAPPPAQSVARLGGDEFTVLLDDLAQPADALRVAERLLNVIRQPLAFEGREVFTTASIGVVLAGPDYDSARDVLRDADVAMYRAKADGKNRCVLFDATMHQQAVARLELESNLRRALERGELLLHYQPIVSMATRDLDGFEALIRWKRDEQMISPAQFIPVAEDTGLILPIGRWVLEEAVRQLAAWRDAAPDALPITISVNVSRKQLADPDLVAHARAVVENYNVDPAQVKLEVTESVVMENGDAARQKLKELREIGFRFAMDDFGTGYSSLSCLHQFPIDVVKLDRSFIQHFAGRRDAAAVIHSVITLAHNLGISVVAEGLETAEQAALLEELDCDLGQGYLFAKPLPADEAQKLLVRPPIMRLCTE
jgi:diguanylate cyclase (GGDEF)-like protein